MFTGRQRRDETRDLMGGTWNVGIMTGKDRELVGMMNRKSWGRWLNLSRRQGGEVESRSLRTEFQLFYQGGDGRRS